MIEVNDEPVATQEESKKINVINKETVHKICSGQVVLDLAVAIKELVENSLDSGATSVDVKLIDHGKSCITVSDNGSGVLESDFEGLGLRHHTSKLRDFSDIFEVSTFGFRGEALSSLCSLSDVTIITNNSNNKHAYKLKFDKNGNLEKKDICAREIGTTVIVKNIFKNLPVRAKEFHRNIKKEFSRAVQILYGYCLVSTGIKITCTNTIDGKTTNKIVGTNRSNSVLDMQYQYLVPDDDIIEEFNLPNDIVIDFKWNFLTSSCEHGMGRASPDRQFFFVNGRPCNILKIAKLINNIYHKFNNKQYPFVFINLLLNQLNTDVNVTPDKRTIFLTQEKLILAVIKMSLLKKWQKMQGNFKSQTLEQLQYTLKRNLTSPSRENTPPQKKKMIQLKQHVNDADNVDDSGNADATDVDNKNKIDEIYYEKLPDSEMKINIDIIKLSMKKKCELNNIDNNCNNNIKFRAKIDPSKSSDAEKELMKELSTESFIKMKIIGQFNLGFIIAELDDDLFIIDQHATDEKYRFEKLNNETILKTQKLIIPKSLNLSSLNETILIDNRKFFDANGFTFNINTNDDYGKRVMLTGIPVSGNWQFDQQDIEELIFLIKEGGTVDDVMMNQDNGKILRPSRVRQMLASRACRGAVMIGTNLNHSEMKRLINQMGVMKNPWNCPHGRPTIRHLISLKLL
ncbi:hypothetical protein HCN44_000902 [Aphidius gifuensis]|uniref:Mismatch repair endonuclease PMS2 n=1 Tax=Aphidius gifuensis TaxID=684658 RepID=A0A834XN57_APHGI|nr:hypothetical protein HCN44_000902 [Aphidius gifuensis]